MGGLPSGRGLCGGRLRHPGRLILAAGPAAGRAYRALRTPTHVVRVGQGPCARQVARRHRARARREQRGGCRVRVSGPDVDR